MKLYLSSQKLGFRPDLLIELVGNNKNVVVIVNALDDKTTEHRNERAKRELDLMRSVGFIAEELDLRKYFGKKKELRRLLKTKSLVWVRGGNTFLLSRAFQASGFDKIIKPMVKKNEIVFGGYSAALLIASKSLFGTEMVDDINSIPKDYPKAKKLKSLNFLNFYLVPHYDSKEDWATNVKEHVNYLKKNKRKVVTLCDGEVYFCSDNKKGGIVK